MARDASGIAGSFVSRAEHARMFLSAHYGATASMMDWTTRQAEGRLFAWVCADRIRGEMLAIVRRGGNEDGVSALAYGILGACERIDASDLRFLEPAFSQTEAQEHPGSLFAVEGATLFFDAGSVVRSFAGAAAYPARLHAHGASLPFSPSVFESVVFGRSLGFGVRHGGRGMPERSLG